MSTDVRGRSLSDPLGINKSTNPFDKQPENPKKMPALENPQAVPVTENLKKRIGPFSDIQKKLSTFTKVILITALALAILGLGLLGLGVGGGVFPIFLTLPLLFIAYNSYRVRENLKVIDKNPQQFVNATDWTKFDPQLLKQQLQRKTLWMNWIIDKGTDRFLKAIPAHAA